MNFKIPHKFSVFELAREYAALSLIQQLRYFATNLKEPKNIL